MANINEAFSLSQIESFTSDDIPLNIAYDSIRLERIKLLTDNLDTECTENLDSDKECDDMNNLIQKFKIKVLDKYSEYQQIENNFQKLSNILTQIDDLNVNLKIHNQQLKQYNLDLDKYSILQETCKNHYDNCLKNLKQIKKELKHLLHQSKQVTNLENVRICPICLSNEVNVALNPCGHTFCNSCIEKNSTNICSICRQMFVPIKLFFS